MGGRGLPSRNMSLHYNRAEQPLHPKTCFAAALYSLIGALHLEQPKPINKAGGSPIRFSTPTAAWPGHRLRHQAPVIPRPTVSPGGVQQGPYQISAPGIPDNSAGATACVIPPGPFVVPLPPACSASPPNRSQGTAYPHTHLVPCPSALRALSHRGGINSFTPLTTPCTPASLASLAAPCTPEFFGSHFVVACIARRPRGAPHAPLLIALGGWGQSAAGLPTCCQWWPGVSVDLTSADGGVGPACLPAGPSLGT